jgi:hypothetical protein
VPQRPVLGPLQLAVVISCVDWRGRLLLALIAGTKLFCMHLRRAVQPRLQPHSICCLCVCVCAFQVDQSIT